MSSFASTVAKNSALGLVAQLAIKVLSFAFTVLIVRQLGADDYGQYAAVLAFGATFAIFGDLGLSLYAVRQVARWRTQPDGPTLIRQMFSNILAVRLILSVVTTGLLVLTAWLTGRPPVMIAAIALSSIGLWLYAVHGSSEAILSGMERIALVSGTRVVNQLAFVALGGVALWWGFGYMGLIVANLLGVAAMTWLCWQAAFGQTGALPRPDPRQWWPLLRASLPFGLIGLAIGLSYRFDTILLNIYWGDAITGYYNSVYNLIFSAVMISNVVNTALYPSYTREVAADPARLPVIAERVLRYVLALSLPMAFGLWAVAEPLVPFLFDEAYAPAAPVLQILAWVIPFMFASEFLGYIVVIADHESRVARAVGFSSALNVGLNLLMVPVFGLIGAAVLTVLTEVVLVAQHSWTLRATLRQFNLGRVVVRPVLAAALMGGLVWAAQAWFPLWALLVLGAIGYAVLSLLLRVVQADDLAFLKRLRKPA